MKAATKAAADLQPGDMVDLEGDPFADPERSNIALDCEYQIVCDVERETAGCVAVGFEGFDVIGFPPGHHLRVAGRVPL